MVGLTRCIPIAVLHWMDDIQVGRFSFANYDYDNNAVFIQSYNFHSGLLGFEPLLH